MSARNRLPGTVTLVKGEASTRVSLQVGDNHVVSPITTDSADALGLEPGQQVVACVKASDVMITTNEGVA